jgi:hypothetical protein
MFPLGFFLGIGAGLPPTPALKVVKYILIPSVNPTSKAIFNVSFALE